MFHNTTMLDSDLPTITSLQSRTNEKKGRKNLFHKQKNTDWNHPCFQYHYSGLSRQQVYHILCHKPNSIINYLCFLPVLHNLQLSHKIIPSRNDVTYKLQQADVFSQCSYTTSKSQSKHYYSHH